MNSTNLSPEESYISTQNITYTHSRDLKRLSGQRVTSNFYWCLGLNGTFVLEERIMMFEVRYDCNLPFNRDAYKSYITLSLSWVFKNFGSSSKAKTS